MSAVDGPFAETNEQLGGFVFIEARDLNKAIQVAGSLPVAAVGNIKVARTRPRPDRAGRETSALRRARDSPGATPELIDSIYRADSRLVLATLIRLLGDFDLAEEAVPDAFLRRPINGPETACRVTPARGSSPPGGSRRSTDSAGEQGSMRPSASSPCSSISRRRIQPRSSGGRRRRCPAVDLHLLPPGAVT